MREVWIVLAREFAERVRTRSFVLGTLLVPLLLIAIMLLPRAVGGERERRIVVIDDAPGHVGETFVVALNRAFIPALDTLVPVRRRGTLTRYDVEHVRGAAEPLRTGLSTQLAADEIDGYVVLPADVRESGRIEFRAARAADPAMLRDIRVAATEAVQADRLARSGLRVDIIADVLRPVTIDDGRVDAQGRHAGGLQAGFYFAYIVAAIIYMMIALYGTGVTRSVIEEKQSRIAEVLVSSVPATQLMAGKILGVAGAVLLQVVIWIAALMLIVARSAWLSAQFGIDAALLESIAAQPATTLLLLAYFILGFLLFASLFAALGAAVTSDQEAQALQLIIMLPLFVPLPFLLQLTTQPLDPLARTLGLLPLTAPVAMPMRMAAANIPTGEVLLSIVLLAAAVAATAWFAAHIYRIGLLNTGRRATLRELFGRAG